MSNLDKQKNFWKPCRPGTILNASDSRFKRERRRFLIRSSMGAVVGGMGIFSLVFMHVHQRRRIVASRLAAAIDNNNTLVRKASTTKAEFVPLNCQQIKDRLTDYVSVSRLEENDRSNSQQTLARQFDVHLKVCHACNIMVGSALQTG